MSKILKFAAVFGFAVAACASGAGSQAQAAPLPTSVATIKDAAASHATNVQYRRFYGGGWRGYGWRGYGWRGYPYRYGYGYGWGWPYYGAAFATGALVGAAATAPYYYGPGAGYYAPPPAAVSGATRQCWVETDSSRRYGYWAPC